MTQIFFTVRKCAFCKKDFRPQGGRQIYCNPCRAIFASPKSKREKLLKGKPRPPARAKRVIEARKQILPTCLSKPIFDPLLDALVLNHPTTYRELFACQLSIQQSL